ncbi:phage scaffolding protein [Clostridium baratii]
MPKLSEIIGDNFNSLSEEIKTKYKNIDLVDSSKYVKKEQFDAKETELETTKTQLKEANDTIQSYKDMDIESIKSSAEQWKDKYETETKELKDKLNTQKREFAAKDFLDKHNFASERVKKSVLKDFLDKEFKLENDNFLGADDWIKALKESEPEIFKTEETNNNQVPRFKIGYDGSEQQNNSQISMRDAIAAHIQPQIQK